MNILPGEQCVLPILTPHTTTNLVSEMGANLLMQHLRLREFTGASTLIEIANVPMKYAGAARGIMFACGEGGMCAVGYVSRFCYKNISVQYVFDQSHVFPRISEICVDGCHYICIDIHSDHTVDIRFQKGPIFEHVASFDKKIATIIFNHLVQARG